MLFDTRKMTVVRQRQAAASRDNRTVENFQQRAFAAAVVADKPNAIAFFQGKRQIVEKRAERGINVQGLCG